MRSRVFRAACVAAAGSCLALTPVTAVAGQAEPAAQQPGVPAAPLPPADSPPIFRNLQLSFPTQGGVPTVETNTYLYYMESDDLVDKQDGNFTPYDDAVEKVLLDDFQRLWDTDFLNDIVIEIIDDPYPNGVVGKRAVFLLDERERVRIITFEGSDQYDRTEIDEAMVQVGVELRTDTRVDPGVIRNTEGLLRSMWGEKGYQFAEVSHTLTPMTGGPKIAQLIFNIDEGPKVEVHDIEFVGNDSMSAGTLKKQMKNTRERWLLSLITNRGAYRPLGFEQDADALVAHYRASGYIDAQVGLPDLEYSEVSADGKKRPVRLRISVTEGERYRVGTVDFDGEGVVRLEALEEIFSDLKPGGYYEEGKVRDAMQVAQEAYGSGGYYEMTGFPDTVRRADDHPEARIEGDPVIDVTLRLQEGEQYFVNRIKFRGNNTTHDEVIRRELGLVERGIFDTSALQYSVRRLNQLGYFEPLDEQNAIQIEKRPGFDNEVDLTLELTEANLNQLTFGAGASQFDGFFLQLSFQTTNFLGRGESLSVSVQNGERIKNYQLSFTEPYLFNKPITGGLNLFRRDIRFIRQFTQSSIGGGASIGFRVGQWSQMFVAYSYEATNVRELNPAFLNPEILRFNPFLADALLLGQDSARTISKIIPSFRLNTIDHPIFPTTGKSYSLSIELPAVGGNTKFYKPVAEAIWYLKHAPRLSFGFRARAEYIEPLGSTSVLPIFNLLTMGGEFSLRGFDIRSIGPSDSELFGLVIGGNKSLLFNAEYIISIANPVRIIFFYDTGQVADFGEDFAMNQFRSSTGAELRFFMPVLNIPFRLIYAWNPNVKGILNDRFQPQESTVFKFAVGTTF